MFFQALESLYTVTVTLQKRIRRKKPRPNHELVPDLYFRQFLLIVAGDFFEPQGTVKTGPSWLDLAFYGGHTDLLLSQQCSIK